MNTHKPIGSIATVIQSGYNPKEFGQFRNPSSVSEMVSWCDSHGHITLLDGYGRFRTVKVNGKVRTWKRDSNRVEVPYKYGLYEYGTLDASDISRVLIPV